MISGTLARNHGGYRFFIRLSLSHLDFSIYTRCAEVFVEEHTSSHGEWKGAKRAPAGGARVRPWETKTYDDIPYIAAHSIHNSIETSAIRVYITDRCVPSPSRPPRGLVLSRAPSIAEDIRCVTPPKSLVRVVASLWYDYLILHRIPQIYSKSCRSLLPSPYPYRPPFVVLQRATAPPPSDGSDDIPTSDSPVTITVTEARAILGLPENARFEAAVLARDRAVTQADGDATQLKKIDAAYDVLLMQSMRARLDGDVDTKVRFADVPKYRPPVPVQPPLVELAPISTSKDAVLAGVVFGALTLSVVATGATATPGLPDPIPFVQLAGAVGVGTYLQKDRKGNSWGKAAGLTGGALLAGVVVGEVLQAWARVDLVPLVGISSPAEVVGLVAVLAAWGATQLLR